MLNPPAQYATDHNLAARQRFWAISRREPSFDLFSWVLDQVALVPGSSLDVLDLGCGNGRYEQALERRGHAGGCVALDLSAGMLVEVEAGSRVQGDAQCLPLRPGTFDVVLAPHMLYHVPDVERALHEARRVLRAGGTFVAVTNGEANLFGLAQVIEEVVGGGWRMRRPAEEQFSLENGAAQLDRVFSSVQRVDCPTGDVVVTDVDAFAAYVASTADHYQEEVDVPWDDVVRGARERCAQQVSATGSLRLGTAVGAFICR